LDEALWTVLPESKRAVSEGAFTYNIQHVREAAPHLLLQLDFYTSGIIRLRLNEVESQAVRHVIPAGDVVTDPPPKGAKVTESRSPQGTSFTFKTDAGATVKATLKHVPLGLEVMVDDVLVQRVNARNLLNFERYRDVNERHSTLRPPDANSKDISVTVDAAAHPSVDKTGLWEEDFGGHTDKKPRGPASVGMDVSFEGDVPSLFGLPEHATNASLPFYEEPYRFFNLDVFEYEIDEPMALYGAIPILWGIHRASGVQKKPVVSGFLWIIRLRRL
jgi:alpha 1,3-glucosidase